METIKCANAEGNVDVFYIGGCAHLCSYPHSLNAFLWLVAVLPTRLFFPLVHGAATGKIRPVSLS